MAVLAVWTAAHRYHIPALETECVQRIGQRLTMRNVAHVFKAARAIQDEALADACFALANQTPGAVYGSAGLEQVDEATFYDFLVRLKAQNQPLLPDTIAMYRMIVDRWSVAECVRRQDATSLGNRRHVVSNQVVDLIDGDPKMKMGDFERWIGGWLRNFLDWIHN